MSPNIGYTRPMQGYDTPHDVIEALDRGVASGQFKNCAHLKYTLGPGPYAVIQFYYPVCAKDCFAPIDAFGQGELRCPENCRLHVNRDIYIGVQNSLLQLEKEAERRKRFWHGVGAVLVWPFTYFQKLPAIVQSLLIILVIIRFLPRFKDTIIEILKALGGK
jgi:hypothetical protein